MKTRICTKARHGMTALVVGLALTITASAPARALSFSDLPLMGTLFGDTGGIPITEAELASVGCVVTGSAAAVATLLLGGTAALATGGAGTATIIAVPVMVGAAAAGCAFGAAAAPGLAWFGRNGDKLTHSLGQRVGQTIDDTSEALEQTTNREFKLPPLPQLPIRQ